MPDQAEPDDELSFEQALGLLQRIVESLERGESDLSSALSQYEWSVTLLTHCNRLLDQAEQSVALLSGVDAQGNPITTPFDATATIAREPDPDCGRYHALTRTEAIQSSSIFRPQSPGCPRSRRSRST